MGLSQRKNDEKTVKEFNLNAGIFTLKVVAYNPNLKKLKEMGMNFDSEPEYITDDNFNEGYKQYLATFWLTNVGTKGENLNGEEVDIPEGSLIVPLTFSISQKDVESQTGKTGFINKYGQMVYATSKEEIPEWFNAPESVRVAKNGEEELYKFLFAYANLQAPSDKEEGDGNCLEDPNQLFTDDSELKEVANSLIGAENMVKCMVGLQGRLNEGNVNVRQKVYRGFYQKFIQKSAEVNFKSFINAEKVKPENKEDQKDRRNPLKQNIHFYSFVPVQLSLTEAIEEVKPKMDIPDSDGDAYAANTANEAEADF